MAAIADTDAAMYWLDLARQQGAASLRDLRAHPFWDPLRADPRWPALLADIGYPPWNPDPGVLSDTGRAVALVGRPDEAMRFLERALELRPTDPRSVRWRVSVALARRTLAAAPGRFAAEDANPLLAAVYGLRGEQDLGQCHYQAALATWPTFDPAYPPLPAYTEPKARQRHVAGLRAVVDG